MSKTFLDIQARYQILSGDDSVLTTGTTGDSHINAAIDDITSTYPFSWLRTAVTASLSSGVITLPSNYQPAFGIEYARIVTGEDLVQKDAKGMQDNGTNGYIITYVPGSDAYTLTCQTLTGSVLYYYYYTPTALSDDSDICFIPDPEAVAYLAAAKNWIGSERNEALQMSYAKEADRRIKAMIQQDAAFGPVISEDNISSYNLNGY
jgi:hypothetical protein